MRTIGLMLGCLLSSILVFKVTIGMYLRRKSLGFIWSIWRRFRFAMLPEVFLMIAMTVCGGLTLMHFVPWLRWGWANLFSKNGGNAALAPIFAALNFPSRPVQLLVPFFLVLFVINMPFFVKREEDLFRKGYYKWPDLFEHSVRFGLVHVVMGIPLGFVLAIIPTGFFLALKYRFAYLRLCRESPAIWSAEEEATLITTTYHTMYNTAVLSVAIGTLLFVIFR
jgi:hypothetical protein